jgi:WD40 repeat protein
LSRLFISHSSSNDDWAIALRDWLVREGWSGPEDIFLDLDPDRGIAVGQRWADALKDAATRCEAVLFIVSQAWLASKWCGDEYQLASSLNKKLFALLIDDIPLDRLPGGLTAQWQIVRLTGEPAERFLTVHPLTQHQSPVHVAEAGLKSLKRGLDKAGIGTETFDLKPDPNGPFGWRAPYRGLEALEPEDAAVFLGRSADIVRGIDALRGLAAHKAPRLLVILGASGAGKSSFLRAGLWPRLLRDDSQWLPLKAIRASRGGAIEGREGLLSAIEDAHARFALPASLANLRERLATPESFIALLRDLRQSAARRAFISEPPYPLPILCFDQAEELFAADAGPESEKLLRLARAAIDADAALLLVTIRSDAYGAMQNAPALTGIDQVPLSLGLVPHGEIGRIIREPAEILRRKAGPSAPVFDAAVVERLQNEIEGEADSLPLLAFVLQRLMREHAGTATIGLAELERTGGVAAAIESEAEAALDDAGLTDRAGRRDALRRLFIPRLAGIDRDSKAPQRRIARQSELPADLIALARALTQRRLLVIKLAGEAEGAPATDGATLEVAHEALLRRWPTLADLLAEDRDALLLLDGVISAAADWEKADAADKPDYLAHRGSRLADALLLASRGPDWEHAIAPARAYLEQCRAKEDALRAEEEIRRQEREQEQARRLADAQALAAANVRTARRTRIGLVAALILAIAAAAFGFVAQREQTIADQKSQEAQVQRDAAAKAATEATTKEAEARHNQFAALAALSSAALATDPARAVKLALAAWPRQPGDSTPKVAVALDALSAAVVQSRERKVLSTDKDGVGSAAFSPDGTRIVAISGDHMARLWDAATAKQVAVFSAADASAAFSPDGKRIVAADYNNARIWDAATGKQIAVLTGHDRYVRSAAFSPDGTRIVTASDDGTARVWDTATAKQIAVLSGHKGGVESAAYSPDGKRIVTAGNDGTARLWDAATAKETATLRHEKEEVVYTAAFSPDGKSVLTASSDGTARLWDAATAKQISALRSNGSIVWSAAFSPDGTRIVTASDDHTIGLWDTASATSIAVLRGHTEAVLDAAFSPDGLRIVTASNDHTVRLWDAASPKQAAVLRGQDDPVYSAAFSPDGSRVVTASADKMARLWDTATGQVIAVLRGHTGVVQSAAFSADGKRVVTTSFDHTARLWDVATAKPIAVLNGHTATVYSAAFSPDGTRIVTGSSDATVRLWDAATGKQIAVLSGINSAVKSVAFSPDGTRIITAADDELVRLWDAATAKQITVLHDAGEQAAFSPDGTRIITASSSGFTARLWDVATAKLIAALPRQTSPVVSAAFSPDGTRVVTASLDNTARLFDLATAEEIATIRGHENYVYTAAFSPDGKLVVTASQDKTARLWAIDMIPKGNLFAIACADLPDQDVADIAKNYGMSNLEPICTATPPLPDPAP